jgi:hypothetical protein
MGLDPSVLPFERIPIEFHMSGYPQGGVERVENRWTTAVLPLSKCVSKVGKIRVAGLRCAAKGIIPDLPTAFPQCPAFSAAIFFAWGRNIHHCS